MSLSAWRPDNGATFISQDLAPAFAAAGIHLAGLAWHCYGGSPSTMSQLHAQYPGITRSSTNAHRRSGRWNTAETVISSLRNWASAPAVSKIALDPG